MDGWGLGKVRKEYSSGREPTAWRVRKHRRSYYVCTWWKERTNRAILWTGIPQSTNLLLSSETVLEHGRCMLLHLPAWEITRQAKQEVVSLIDNPARQRNWRGSRETSGLQEESTALSGLQEWPRESTLRLATGAGDSWKQLLFVSIHLRSEKVFAHSLKSG